MKNLLSIFLLVLACKMHAQYNQQRVDSLNTALASSSSDAQKCEIYLMLAEQHNERNNEKFMGYAMIADSLADVVNYKNFKAKSRFFMAKAYMDREMYSEALKYYFEALPLAEEIKDLRLQHRMCNNIGNAYSFLKQNDNAMKYFEMALKIAIEDKDEMAQAKYSVNLGTGFKRMGQRDKANEYYTRALITFSKQKYAKGIMQCYINISTLYGADLDWKSTEEYLLKAMHVADSLRDKGSLITIFNNLGAVYAITKDWKRAKVMFDSTVFNANLMGSKASLAGAYAGLAEVSANQGDFKTAYEYASLHQRLNDSLEQSVNLELISGAQEKYNSLENLKKIELLKKNEEIHKLQSSQNKIFIGLLVLIVLFVVVAAFFFYSRSRQRRKANEMLQEHNAMVEHQKKEITDSINYAKKIQMSILPPDGLVKRLLPDSFVLYKPKDIVSGDFYWIDECDGQVLFASVDCTGHGVPGAMMSVLGFNLLSGAINEKRLTKPALILEHLDFGVDKMLRQSTDENSVRDGMDISVCSLNYKTGLLQFAGAYNGMWMVKAKDRQFVEVKADKMMIGVNAGGQADHFTNHEIQLEKGDVVYIFSDGYADQFGGPNGKKFKYKPMKHLLLEIFDKPMAEQRRLLDQNVEKWRGDLEQVDDILVIGVRY